MITLAIIVAFIIIIFLSTRSRNPRVKGEIGETNIVKDFESINFWGYKGYSLRNVYVPYRGKTAEIDVLYITTKGIIVVESKNYSGYIFGNENQQQWTSTLYAGKHSFKSSNKYKFYNPIWQNRTHINALQEYLGGVRAFSFIVFGTKCELMNLTYSPEDVCICKEDEFKKIVKQKLDSLEDIYAPDEVIEIYDRLLSLPAVNDELKENHINAIYESANSDVCPRCGGQLVLRTAKKGPNTGNQFYGCSNYPSCRFIRNIE